MVLVGQAILEFPTKGNKQENTVMNFLCEGKDSVSFSKTFGRRKVRGLEKEQKLSTEHRVSLRSETASSVNKPRPDCTAPV